MPNRPALPPVNTLYYGDNLDILRSHEYFPTSIVDLIYIDPPFNSKATYSLIYKEQSGERSSAQQEAFTDTWQWDQSAVATLDELRHSAPSHVRHMVNALYEILGTSDMMAYLVMMTPRLVELHRVLKPTGSLYLHCDPTAGAYLKVLLDTIFGRGRVLNEIIWKRTSAHNDPQRWGSVHDTILFATKSDTYTWNQVYQAYGAEYLEDKYVHKDDRGTYRLSDLTAPGTSAGADSSQPWRGHEPATRGRHWAVPTAIVAAAVGAIAAATMTTVQKLDVLDEQGYIYWTPRGRRGAGAGFPQYKRYLGAGTPIQDVINDIPPINSMAQERLGYPTQKPLPLLERIIRASSNPGDLVLDAFCGCGTAIVAAQALGREWIGIDITHLAIGTMRKRLRDQFGEAIESTYDVIGEPKDLESARALAEMSEHDGRYQFQWWALSRVRAQAEGGQGGSKGKKGADKGVDGRIPFTEYGDKQREVIIQVKSGKVDSQTIRDLIGTMQQQPGAAIGVLITLKEPTAEMRKVAANAGYYRMEHNDERYPTIQMLTIEDLFNGRRIEMPARGGKEPGPVAPRIRTRIPTQGKFEV